MAAINSAVAPAVMPGGWSGRQQQQIGELSGTDASYGFNETLAAAASIPGGQSEPTPAANPLVSTEMDFLGEAMASQYSPPAVTGPGPSIPYEASVQQAQVAHGIDDGTVAKNAPYATPSPGNKYFTTVVKTAAQAPTTAIDPQGMNVYTTPGVATYGQVIRTGDHANLNDGIGYYLQEGDRAFFNTLAATAPVQEVGTTGYQIPYGGVEQQGYNDGGIPTVYAAPPDPYVSPTAVGTEAPPMGGGWS